jgi:hypothetical protein
MDAKFQRGINVPKKSFALRHLGERCNTLLLRYGTLFN